MFIHVKIRLYPVNLTKFGVSSNVLRLICRAFAELLYVYQTDAQMNSFSENEYEKMIGELFVRFPSFQKAGQSAYKPGIANMEFFDQMNGHPHHRYATVHVAGTNGKGSVCSMLASVLAASGLKVGLYTSPHILDFRERMRILDGTVVAGSRQGSAPEVTYISKEEVWNFITRWRETFEHLDMSFFEITTSMAFDWFAASGVDAAVIETGLGGRLDSTEIITPVLSVITNIGLDHCDLLGDTLGEIAFEKAGIIKPGVPAVVGESDPETDPVFERKVLYSNLALPQYMGDRSRIMSLLTFADKISPRGWERHEEILGRMDLKGEYQVKNLRTVLACVQVLASSFPTLASAPWERIGDAIEHAAQYSEFHGRWETVSEDPWIICDIGHNAHGLKYNFHQLSQILSEGRCSKLIIVYGTVADKDYSAVFPLMPESAAYIFTNASGRRACPAGTVMARYEDFCRETGRDNGRIFEADTVEEAVAKAVSLAREAADDCASPRPLIYIGGSTYVVSEAVAYLKR